MESKNYRFSEAESDPPVEQSEKAINFVSEIIEL